MGESRERGSREGGEEEVRKGRGGKVGKGSGRGRWGKEGRWIREGEMGKVEVGAGGGKGVTLTGTLPSTPYTLESTSYTPTP